MARLPGLGGAALRTAGVVVAGGVIFAPLSSLVIWSFTHKWFWPHPFPQEMGFFYWRKVLEGDLFRALQSGFLIAVIVTALTLVLTVFAGASGIAVLFGPTQWLLRAGVLVLLVAIPALRAAEERGATGVQAVGQGALQLLAVTEIAIAITLLDLPQPVGPALVALGFHAWGGAADALLGGTPVRGVAIEFGSLALLGVLVALFLSQ